MKFEGLVINIIISSMAVLVILSGSTCYLFHGMSDVTVLKGPVHEAWVAHYDAPEGEWDEAEALVVDADGNVYVTGQSQGNIVTIKYDTDGNQLWIRYHDEPYACWAVGGVSIGVDDCGNVYVAGDCTSKMGDYDFVTIKYDTNGDELWVRHYDGPASSHDSARSLAIDSAGDVYVTGSSDDGDGLSNYATLKYDADGHEIWVSRYEGLTGTDCYSQAIAVDSFGNVYVTGWMWLYSDKAGWATVAYDTDGNELWAAHDGNESVNDMALYEDESGTYIYVTGGGTTVQYDGNGNEVWCNPASGHALAVDMQGNAYITGVKKSNKLSGNDPGIVKYDSHGNELWTVIYDNCDTVTDIVVDASGDVCVTGYDNRLLDRRDYVTIMHKSDGNILWEARYNGIGYWSAGPNAIAMDDPGNVYVTGMGEEDFLTIKYTQ